MLKVKPGLRLRISEKLIITMAPAQACQIVTHSSGRVSKSLILLNAGCTVALGHFLAVRPMNERDMCVGRNLPPHGSVNLDLPRRIVQMIVAANDMGNAHIIIINYNRQHIHRAAI